MGPGHWTSGLRHWSTLVSHDLTISLKERSLQEVHDQSRESETANRRNPNTKAMTCAHVTHDLWSHDHDPMCESEELQEQHNLQCDRPYKYDHDGRSVSCRRNWQCHAGMTMTMTHHHVGESHACVTTVMITRLSDMRRVAWQAWCRCEWRSYCQCHGRRQQFWERPVQVCSRLTNGSASGEQGGVSRSMSLGHICAVIPLSRRKETKLSGLTGQVMIWATSLGASVGLRHWFCFLPPALLPNDLAASHWIASTICWLRAAKIWACHLDQDRWRQDPLTDLEGHDWWHQPWLEGSPLHMWRLQQEQGSGGQQCELEKMKQRGPRKAWLLGVKATMAKVEKQRGPLSGETKT